VAGDALSAVVGVGISAVAGAKSAVAGDVLSHNDLQWRELVSAVAGSTSANPGNSHSGP
jgi:Zn-dependent alcohol dehydrogenase